MQVSARNSFKGIIQSIHIGAVNADITLEIGAGLRVVSVITKASTEVLNLTVGQEAGGITI